MFPPDACTVGDILIVIQFNMLPTSRSQPGWRDKNVTHALHQSGPTSRLTLTHALVDSVNIMPVSLRMIFKALNM
jgi:hypothetical protein